MHALFDERRYLIPFRSTLLPQIFTGTLVIGGGAGGLSCALEASRHGDVIVLCKDRLTLSNTAWAQGGIAAVLAGDDSVNAHVRDTLEAGAGLCDEPVVRRVVSAGPDAIARLRAWGFQPDLNGDGPALGQEGGHSTRRIVHASGDATGQEVARALIEQAKARTKSSLRLFEKCFVIDLLTADGGGGAGQAEPGAPCLGALTWHARYGLQVIWASATVLASGGAGMLWRETTNPPVATGDGVAMAYRAGASIQDAAFMQFHPTALYVAGAARLLISEAVRGEGAHLLDAPPNEGGERFMVGRHPRAELAPRDVVSLEIFRALARKSVPNVWLDCRHISGFAARFPGIAGTLRQFDLDPSKDLIPVNPAAHYFVGGVRADDCGRTDVPGLFCIGEAASTGLHGANRLASNSLLEAVVFGVAAGEAIGAEASARRGSSPAPRQITSEVPVSHQGDIDLSDVRSSVRSAMWRNVGLERAGVKLRDATDMLDFWARYTLDKVFDEPAGWEVQNMLLSAALVARSALWRVESRGCHTRTDAPEPSPRFAVHDAWRKGLAGPIERAVAEG
ncbi:MAG: L-aspartate oxidase [Phycisphaerales bacterium]